MEESAVSRIVGTLRQGLKVWQQRSLADVELAYLDAIALRVRMGRRVTSVPVLVALGVLADGSKQLLAMELCTSESRDAWQGLLTQPTARGLNAPKISVVDGNPGLRGAIERSWPRALVQRCTVHKLRNPLRKAPAHAVEEIKADYHRIVYAASLAEARKAYAAFVRKWDPARAWSRPSRRAATSCSPSSPSRPSSGSACAPPTRSSASTRSSAGA